MNICIRRGDIYYADLSPVVGSEQGGVRPVLIVQNDIGNKYSPTVIAAAITSQTGKARLPTHLAVQTDGKRRLKEKMGHLDDRTMKQVNEALYVSFGLTEETAVSSPA